SPCIRCATCDGYPCLVNGKADAHIVCVEPALRHPNVTLRTRTRVMRLETDGPGRTVTRVVADRDGQAETYSADLVVVSAGAINSAALLLASASERHPAGLGNSSGVVGRHLVVPVLKDAGQVHSEVGHTALAAASIADFAAIVLLSLFFSASGGSTGAPAP